jgi:predicted dehydrogenase
VDAATLRTLQVSSTPRPVRGQPVPGSRKVRLGFVGAGNYATSMLLPHLARNAEVDLAAVATTRSLSAANAQRKFGFGAMTTDTDVVLDDPTLDAIFVVTRHHSHADLVCAALERGKAVFVEKPLALTEEQLERVRETVVRTGNDRVMVGFNRRFAPLFTDLRHRFGPSRGPVSARYLVNAGRLDPASWYLNEDLEGSRFLGEGGHFIDTLSAWVDAPPITVHALQTIGGGDLHVTLTFADGSVGTVGYVTGGSARFPKETFDVSGGGLTARLDNFTRATVWNGKGKDVKRSLSGQDKGQGAELERFVAAVRSGDPMPIDWESLVATTRATIAVTTSLTSGTPVTL